MHRVRTGTHRTNELRSPRNRRRRRPPAAGRRAAARARSSTSPRPRSSRRGTSSWSAGATAPSPSATPHPLGLYRDDCRFLSGHELCVNRVRPRLLVASAASGSESVHELTNPALPLPGGRVLPLQSLQLRLERRIVADDEVEETLLVHSYDREPLYLDIDLLLAADFEPMLAIRGILATGRGEPVAVERRADGVRFSQRGRDGLHRALTVTADRSAEPGEARARAAVRARAGAGWRGDDQAPLLPARGRRRARGRRGRARRCRAARPTRGWRSARSWRPTTSSSTASCGARCSTSGCCTRAAAATATTPPASPGTRRCSGATR